MITVDRFESGYAVCETEDGGFVNIAVDELPDGAREGYSYTKDVDGRYIRDTKAEQKRAEKIKVLMNRLFE